MQLTWRKSGLPLPPALPEARDIRGVDRYVIGDQLFLAPPGVGDDLDREARKGGYAELD